MYKLAKTGLLKIILYCLVSVQELLSTLGLEVVCSTLHNITW